MRVATTRACSGNGCRHLVFMLALWLAAAGSAVQAGVAQAQEAASLSVIEIPVRISLERLFELAEQEIPQQTGHWRSWQKVHGVKVKYRAWRGALYFTLQGNVLQVQAHVRYWVRVQKKLLNAVSLKSGCGVNEPPRQALIGVQVRLEPGADWVLRPQVQVLPPRFLDRCEMTVASIDVTPLVAKSFQKQLQAKLRTALKALGPRLQAVRQQAERDWSLLQKAVKLNADQWLLLNPKGVALAPLSAHDDSMDTRLALTMAAEIVSGPEPVSRQSPLPPLMRYYPRSTGLNLQLAVDLDYADLDRAISAQLSGESFDVGGRQAVIESLQLGGQGQQLRVRAKLAGEAAGQLTVKANLVFDAETQLFRLQDLEYSYAADDPLVNLQAGLFYAYIREVLEFVANRQLQQRMLQWKDQLVKVLEKITADDMELELASLQLRQVQLDMSENAIRLNGLASGYVSLEFR